MSRMLAVVPHTHWDREWYGQVESYRPRLVAVMDQVMALAEDRADFGPFLLDGQMAAVEDYLAVQPAQAGRLAKLVEAGRIDIGPWYVLMDEFCVSGETIWRNLQLGLATARSLGARSFCGYLPDMFGHTSQMPQILAHAGLEHAVVWRGTPDVVDRTAFWWSAPDGSRVRAEYLPVGYANGAFLPRDPADLVRRVEAHEREISSFLPDPDWPMLVLNGGDHHPPQPWLPDLLSQANACQDRYRFVQTSLPAYLGGAPTAGLAEWSGELRSGWRANLLLGVASNRVDVKQAAAGAERSLEKLAEPMCALWLPAELWPTHLLEDAWRSLILNSAHDSICACSADPVVRAVLARYDSARALADQALAQAVAIAGVATDTPGWVVLNPSSRSRRDVVELILPGDSAPAGTQALESTPAATEVRTGLGADLARLLGQLAQDGYLGPAGLGTDAAIETGPDGVTVRLEVDASKPARPEMAAVMAEVWAQAGGARDQPLRIVVTRAATTRVLAQCPDVPGFGWSTWTPSLTPRLQDGEANAVRAIGAIGAFGGEGGQGLDSGACRVEVDGRDGTLTIDGHAGLGALIDEGDQGDTYTFSPAGSPVRDPIRARYELTEAGPVRGRIRISRWYEWPASLSGGERIGSEGVEVSTDIEVRAGDPLVRATVTFDNRCRDHRLRVLFPLPAPADFSEAECAYGTVRRPAAGYGGGPHEVPVPMFPARRFVQAGGLTVVHDGLLEYELVDDGRVLAVTLLRSVGVLSRPAPPYRPNVAGPALPVPDAQLSGPRQARFAVAIGDHDPWQLADRAWTPLLVGRSTGTGHLPAIGSRLTVLGRAEVSALRRVDGRLEMRVFNPSDQYVTVTIPGHAGSLVDLVGAELARWSDSFELRPWAIATAWLDRPSLDQA